MAWSTLGSGRYSNAPVILAGPILRRVDARTVSVWVAFKNRPGTGENDVTLEIFTPNVPVVPGSPLYTSTKPDSKTLTLGNGSATLNVCLVTYTSGTDIFTAGNTYPYNIRIGGLNLNDNGLLNGGNYTNADLSYDGSGYPSFSLPPANLNDLRVVHGSCRKPQGGMKSSIYDAFVGVDKMIEGAHLTANGNLAEFARLRPHLLFLTGDQIYADDVSDTILHMLRDAIGESGEAGAANVLMGWTEDLPGLDNIDITSGPNKDILYPSQRTRLQKAMTDDNGTIIGYERSGLTTGTHNSHLMKLGEYYGMYLLCWSDVLWPDDDANDEWRSFPSYDTVYGGIDGSYLAKMRLIWPNFFSKNITHRDELKSTPLKRRKYRDQIKLLAGFRTTLPNVRRLLANVPTYMICDDHEITDDWNLNKRWVNTVVGTAGTPSLKPLGRRIIQNGMSAYLLFQGWGNNPSYFNNAPQSDLLTALTQLNAVDQADKFNIVGAKILPDIINVTTPSSDAGEQYLAGSLQWHYTLKFHNSYQFLVLNTRTNRLFPAGNDDRAFVGLLSSQALNEQFQDVITANPGTLTFIVSPSPVFGSAAIDNVSQFTMKIHLRTREDVDAEFWNFNRKYFERFLEKISYFSHVILLGGDVHFGLSRHITYWNKRNSVSAPGISQFASFVSSSFKNEGFTTRHVHNLDKHGLLPVIISTPFVKGIIPPSCTEDIFGWPEPGKHIVTTAGKDKYVEGTPAIFDNFLLPEQTDVWNKYKVANANQPGYWYYRIRPVWDVRTDAARGIDAAAGNIYDPAFPVFPFTAVSKLRKKTEWSRYNFVVGNAHCAEIRLTWDGSNRIAAQKFWFIPTGNENVNTVAHMGNYTIHTIDFNQADADEPGQY